MHDWQKNRDNPVADPRAVRHRPPEAGRFRALAGREAGARTRSAGAQHQHGRRVPLVVLRVDAHRLVNGGPGSRRSDAMCAKCVVVCVIHAPGIGCHRIALPGESVKKELRLAAGLPKKSRRNAISQPRQGQAADSGGWAGTGDFLRPSHSARIADVPFFRSRKKTCRASRPSRE